MDKQIEIQYIKDENGNTNACAFQLGRVAFKLLYVESDMENVDSFFIGETPVTQTQWESVMGYSNCDFMGYDLPVESVEWIECIKFAVRLSLITGKTFWLPTKQEWMYAARGGKKTKGYRYSGSDNLDDIAWHEENSDETTHPVATKLPNELGLYDMNGNVHEWCYDVVCDDERICCGGSFDSFGIEPLDRSDYHYEEQSGVSSSDIGLRLVLLSDEHVAVDFDSIIYHLGGNSNMGTAIMSKRTYEKGRYWPIDTLFKAYDGMVYDLYEWGGSFDYDFVLLLLKLTEGNRDLRSQLEKKLDLWFEIDDF